MHGDWCGFESRRRSPKSMSFSITIGNAIPEFLNESGELLARWTVKDVTLPDAPTFHNDTDQSNHRAPSYVAWGDFVYTHGLHECFFNKDTGLFRDHPGCVMLTPAHGALFSAALAKRRSESTLPPGFIGEPYWKPNGAPADWVHPEEGKYDCHLARLIWLEWWTRWALANCETPAIENS